MEVYSNNSAANQHCLIELNQQDFDREENNIIFLCNPYKNNNKYYYKDVRYGSNITNIRNKGSKLMNNNKKESTWNIHLDQLRSKKVIVCCRYTDCIYLFPGLKIICTNQLYGCNVKKSGWVVLMIATSRNVETNTKLNVKLWSLDDFENINKVKNNTITQKNNHHGSTGYYYSFGNLGSFSTINDSSVNNYCNKKVQNEKLQKGIDNIADQYEQLCCDEIQLAASSFDSTQPTIKYLTSTILDAANTMLNDSEFKNPLYNKNGIGNGCWKTVICVNAQTRDLHSENDATYTTITSPNQRRLKSKYSFIFEVNETTKLKLLMNQGINIIFSGKFLVHHQQCMKQFHGDLFFNFSSYGNKRLFTHLKQTIKRMKSGHEEKKELKKCK